MKSEFVNKDLENEFQALVKRLSVLFEGDAELDLEAIIFLIGVQEVGKGYQRYKKDQKMELMHIATCTLLEPYGYYKFVGTDQDGYPHWELNEALPALKAGEQLVLMKQAVVDYFSNYEL